MNYLSLFYKPHKFFCYIKQNNNLKIYIVTLIGLLIGIISQIVYFFLFVLPKEYNTVDEFGDVEIQFFNINESRLIFLLFIIHVLIIPIITLILRSLLGWLLLKVLRVENLKFNDINNIICFSMITNFWNLVPLIGYLLNAIHLFCLSYIGLNCMYKLEKWILLLFSLIICFVIFQPFSFSTFENYNLR